MRRLVGLIAIGAGVLIGAAMVTGQAGQAPTSPQTFRSATDVVMVDVSVRKDNVPLTGLTAADFDLRDNGVRQDVETAETKAVPIDLSIVVDVSGNPDRPWSIPPPMSQVAADIDEQVRKLTKLLRDGDRVRLFAVDTYVQQAWPLQPASAAPPLKKIGFDGHASLYNTLTTVLLQPVEPTRRHVIVAGTRGLDSVSSITAAGVRAIAERSDAQMHLVMQELDADKEVTVRGFQCMYMDLCSATTRFWTPARRRLFNAIPITSMVARVLYPDGLELKTAAQATGGDLYQSRMFSEATLFGTFEKAFENFRQSYVLRYTPKGVTREGWHQITVTVPRDRSLKIQARSGYAIEAPAPPPAQPAVPITNTTALRTLGELVSAYDRGAFDPVTLNLRQATDPARLILDFDKGGNPWPGSPRREAVFALELAEGGIFSSRQPAREEATGLLVRFGRLVRHPIEPDAFERAWLLTELTMLQGTIRPAATRPFVERALARFPSEPRFLLARAIVTDQEWPLSGMVRDGSQSTRSFATPEHVAAVVAQYEAAAAFPETRAEASVRLGWFLHRIGRSDEAIARFAAATGAGIDSTDRALAYLRELLLGHTLASLGRADEALAAHRRAMSIAPGAQSARVAVMNGLLQQGNRTEAEALAETLQATPGTGIDPWWMYWQGDYRRYPQALAAARGLIR